MQGDLRDPLGEEAHEVAPELVRRYPDRALLIATDRCAVYCRFCTRSRIVGNGGGPRSEERLEPALRWLRANPEVCDVIVSGGDPLAMATERIVRVVAALRAIPSIETIRLATRVPVVLAAAHHGRAARSAPPASSALGDDALQSSEGADARAPAALAASSPTRAFR